MSTWLEVGLLSMAAAAVVMTVTALISRRVGRISVVDVAWGLGCAIVAVVAALAGDGDERRSWLLAGLTAAWGLRLSWHVLRRSRGHGEDPRYAAMFGDASFATVVQKVFVTQGLAICLVMLPVLMAAVTDVEWWPVVWVGVAIWAVGVFFEAVGDAQLAAYKADPDRGPVMDRGLWSWTRHPNYFGDACVSWGLWVAGALASGWLPALVTVVAPVTMTWFLVHVTGARLLEKTMMQRPGYPEYAARTSMFLPLPPRPARGDP